MALAHSTYNRLVSAVIDENDDDADNSQQDIRSAAGASSSFTTPTMGVSSARRRASDQKKIKIKQAASVLPSATAGSKVSTDVSNAASRRCSARTRNSSSSMPVVVDSIVDDALDQPMPPVGPSDAVRQSTMVLAGVELGPGVLDNPTEHQQQQSGRSRGATGARRGIRSTKRRQPDGADETSQQLHQDPIVVSKQKVSNV